MTKANKPDNVAEPVAEEVGEQPTEAKANRMEISHSSSVRQLADLLQLSAVEIIKQLMKKGIMANINQVIDYETAAAIATNYGYEVHHKPRIVQKSAGAVSEIKKHQKLGVINLVIYNYAPLWSRSWGMLTTVRPDYLMLSGKPT